MDQKTLFLTILGMAAVTYLPRLLPVWILSSRNLPQLAVDWLRFVPPAVLAALLLPSLVISETRLDFSTWQPLPHRSRANLPGGLENPQPFCIRGGGDGAGCSGAPDHRYLMKE